MGLWKKLFGGGGGQAPAASQPATVDPAIQEEEEKKTIRELMARLRSSNQDTRYAASDELVRMGAPAVPYLISGMAAGPGEDVRGVILWTLGEICPQYDDQRLGLEALAPLTSKLADDSAAVRANAAWCVGRIGGNGVEKLLLPLAADEEAAVRAAAVEGLGQRRYSDSGSHIIEALLGALKDPDPGVREAAAGGLGSFGDESTRPALQEAAKDSDRAVRDAVNRALERIKAG